MTPHAQSRTKQYCCVDALWRGRDKQLHHSELKKLQLRPQQRRWAVWVWQSCSCPTGKTCVSLHTCETSSGGWRRTHTVKWARAGDITDTSPGCIQSEHKLWLQHIRLSQPLHRKQKRILWNTRGADVSDYTVKPTLCHIYDIMNRFKRTCSALINNAPWGKCCISALKHWKMWPRKHGITTILYRLY